MSRPTTGLLLGVALIAGGRPQAVSPPLSLCDISRDFSAYRDKHVTVRGVYYWGLREACPQKCPDGGWPSFVDLVGEEANWDAVAGAEQTVQLEAKKGKRFEIWVTVAGQLKTMAKRSPLGPCDKVGSRYFGYGHLGMFPAQLVVKEFRDIEVKENPKSPYDYGSMYRGAL